MIASKRKLIAIYFFFLIILGLIFQTRISVQCAGIVENKGTEVNMVDGVSQEEAIIIAKRFLKEKRLENRCTLAFVRVKEPIENHSIWRVIFLPNIRGIFRTPFTFSVDVNKKTGEIELYGWDK